MSQLTRQDIESVAYLCRMTLSEQENSILTDRINIILEDIQELTTLDTDGVTPTSQVISAVNVVRKDEVTPSLTAEQATANGPQVAENCFVVPRVVDT
ncbi:MAG: Asp-tRNA(Asn)/Glu-tRNA(Gln) amidotransferase subunit GatC [Armatimonadetes bacterium]|nr:Asp-tRNA(Asn)/Glu-tRNA(Gln) amidotransferase subunit GatC [Armatimonadota bacterium]